MPIDVSSDPIEAVIFPEGMQGPRGFPAQQGYAAYIPGRLVNDGSAVLVAVFSQASTLTEGVGSARAPASGPVFLPIQKVAVGGVVTVIGHAVWQTGGTIPSITLTPTAFEVGDALMIPPVDATDATLADIALSFT